MLPSCRLDLFHMITSEAEQQQRLRDKLVKLLPARRELADENNMLRLSDKALKSKVIELEERIRRLQACLKTANSSITLMSSREKNRGAAAKARGKENKAINPKTATVHITQIKVCRDKGNEPSVVCPYSKRQTRPQQE